MQDCLLLADKVATLDAAFTTYSRHRAEWDTFAAQHSVQMPDGSWSSEFRGKDAAIAQFKAYQMNDILTLMMKSAPVDVERGNVLIEKLHKHYNEYFGERAILVVKPEVKRSA